MTEIRSESCSACPYRKDVPSGVWAAHEYEKLVEYDKPTSQQPFATFVCHATPEFHCHGWAVVHSNRGHEYELLALRIFPPDNELPPENAPLFSSGTEAAEHGKREIDNPSPETRRAVQRLMRKYERLRKGEVDGPDDREPSATE